MVGTTRNGRKGNHARYLGQCIVGRVSYLDRVKEGNYHTQVTYPTKPNLPASQTIFFRNSLPCPLILLWVHRLEKWYPEQVYIPYPTLDIYLSLSFLPYMSTYLTYPTLSTYPIHLTLTYISLPTSYYHYLLHTLTCISLPYTIARSGGTGGIFILSLSSLPFLPSFFLHRAR